MKSFSVINLRKKSRTFWLLAAFIFAAVLVTAFLWQNAGRASAQVSSFYSTSCLGGWKNTEKATGTPELEDEDDNTKYSDLNSASVSNVVAQIYCGGFKGEIPTDALQKRIVLRFSWATEIPAYPEVNLEASEFEDVAAAIMSVDASSTSVVPEEIEAESEPVVEVRVEEEKEPEPETQEVPAPEEISLLERLVLSKAYAQESTEEKVSEVATSTLIENTEVEVVKEEIKAPVDAILEVVYTLDGSNWSTLGYVSNVSNDVSFEMPMDIFTTIADLERVQIGIRTMSTYDDVPKIYLDSVWLDVEYQKLAVTKGISGFKVFVLTQDRLEASLNDWFMTQEALVVDDLKVENYGGGGYLVVISYHTDHDRSTSARFKLIIGENPEKDAQAFLASLDASQTVRSISATTGSYSGTDSTVTVPIIFIVYE